MWTTVKTVILWNIITIYNNSFLFKYILNVIYSCEGKAEFSTSLLQSSVSHDPSEIILICDPGPQNFEIEIYTSSE